MNYKSPAMMHFTDIRGLAFDLDGTLVDSAPGLANALDQTFMAMNLPLPGQARTVDWIGNGVDILLKRALTWALDNSDHSALLNEARVRFNQHYAVQAEKGSDLFPGVAKVLATLSSHDVPMAIVTNKPTPFIRPLLERLGIADYFRLVLGGDDVVALKPHPAPLFLVLGHWGLLPGQLLFIGDSRNDIQAARAAGCPCVGMTYGYNYGEPIASSQPDLTLESFSDLLPVPGLQLSGYKKYE